METNSLICSLCYTNDADQKNSHIISKFLGIDMLGEKSNRAGYIVRSDSKPQKVQDLPKEDFVFCQSCERKFNTIETVASRALLKNTKESFEENYTRIGTHRIRPENITSKEILIFFYVNYFRLHHSKLEGYEEFQLEDDTYKSIRKTLLETLSEKQSETIELINKSEFEITPITVITTDYTKDPIENILTVNKTTEHKIGMIVCSNWMTYLYQRKSVELDKNMTLHKAQVNSDNKTFVCLEKSMFGKINGMIGNSVINKRAKI